MTGYRTRGARMLVISGGSKPFELSGDLEDLVTRLFTLLDGTRTIDHLADALGDYDRDGVVQIVELLTKRRCVVRLADESAVWIARGPQSFAALARPLEDRLAVSSGLPLRVGSFDATNALSSLAATADPATAHAAALVADAAELRSLDVVALRLALAAAPTVAYGIGEHDQAFVGFVRDGTGPCPRCLAERFPSPVRRWAQRRQTRSVDQPRPPSLPSWRLSLGLIERALGFTLARASEGSPPGLWAIDLRRGVLRPARLAPHFHCPRCLPVEAERPVDAAARLAQELLDSFLTSAPATSRPTQIVRALSKLVDEDVGLFYRLEQAPPDVTLCMPGVNDAWIGNNTPLGRDPIPSLRRLKAFSEACERYSIYNARHHADVRGRTARELGEYAIAEDELTWYAAWQYEQPGFGARTFSAAQKYDWTWFKDLSGATPPVLVPTAYFAYGCDPQLLHPSTEGCASHTDVQQAARAALLEIVEHDAIMVAWLGALHLAGLDASTLPETAQRPIAMLADDGWSTMVVDLSPTWGVPALLGLHTCEREHDGLEEGALVVSHASHSSREEALRRLLDDALTYTRTARQWIKTPVAETPGDQLEHKRYFLEPVHGHEARSVLWPERLASWCEVPQIDESLATLVNQVRSRGHRVLIADITARDVRSLTPFRVVRVLVPGAQPISWGPWKPHALDGRRIAKVRDLLSLPRDAPIYGGPSPF